MHQIKTTAKRQKQRGAKDEGPQNDELLRRPRFPSRRSMHYSFKFLPSITVIHQPPAFLLLRAALSDHYQHSSSAAERRCAMCKLFVNVRLWVCVLNCWLMVGLVVVVVVHRRFIHLLLLQHTDRRPAKAQKGVPTNFQHIGSQRPTSLYIGSCKLQTT